MIIKELLTEASIPWRSASALKERRLREFVTADNLSNSVEIIIQLLGSKLTNDEVVKDVEQAYDSIKSILKKAEQ